MINIEKSNSGFTLIEMLVVIMIISILAAIGVPQYLKAVEKARAAEALVVLGTLNRAEQRYMTRWGKPSPALQTGTDNTWQNDLDVELPDLKYFEKASLYGKAEEKIIEGKDTKTWVYTIGITRNTNEFNEMSNYGKDYKVEINQKGEFTETTPAALR